MLPKSRPKPTYCYSFPKDENLRQQWVIATKRKNFMPTTASRLCSKHFQESDFEVGGIRRRLKKDVVPSIFEFPQHLQPKQAKRRTLCRPHVGVSRPT